MSLVAEHREPEVSVRLREYLGADPNEMPTTGAQFPLGEGTPIALVLARGGDHPMRPASLRLEGVSPVRRACRGCWGGCAAMREHNMFRGRIISLHQHEPGGAVGVEFHAVPAVERDEVILPKGTLERLERHTIGITQSAERLRAAGCGLRASEASGPVARPSGGWKDAVDQVPAACDGRPYDDSVDWAGLGPG